MFQICALREIGTERERRQTIGRGLRLCVNQKGERLRGFDVNTLTVIATESYEQFAENLQKEIEKDTGIKFGIVEKHQFAAIPVVKVDGSTGMLGFEESAAIFDHLKSQGFVDAKGKVQDTLRAALKDGSFALPAALEAHLGVGTGRPAKGNGRQSWTLRTPMSASSSQNAAGDLWRSAEFQALWDRIKHKTTYRVHFDNEKLLADCAKAIANGPPVSKARVRISAKADLSIGQGGVLGPRSTTRTAERVVTIEEGDIALPDVLTDLQDRTQLTRKSLVRILTECGRLTDFKRNPQAFIEIAGEVINRTKPPCSAIVDGIRTPADRRCSVITTHRSSSPRRS